MVKSLRSLAVLRRTALRSYSKTSSLQGGMTPPMAAFKRSPAKFEKQTENIDCLWDDGVAPELALDFDLPNMSSREALWTLAGVFGGFYLFVQGLKLTHSFENPALPKFSDSAVPDYSNFDKDTLETK